VSRDTKGASRAGSGEMSRGSDVAEGALPRGTVLFKVMAGSTVETLMVDELPRMSRGLSSKGSSTLGRAGIASCREGRAHGGVGNWRGTTSRRRKDRRNHPSESHEIDSGHSGASAKRRGYVARTLRRSGDRWRGRGGVDLVNGVGRGGNDGGVSELKGNPSILV